MVCILGGMRSTICVSLYESEAGCIGRVAHQSMLHGLMVMQRAVLIFYCLLHVHQQRYPYGYVLEV